MKTIKWLDKHLEEAIISIMLAIISVLMLFQFILRPLGSSITWSDEACRYLFVWMVGLGIAYASKNGEHLRMDIVPTLLPKTACFFNTLCDIAMVAASVWMISPGRKVISGLMQTGQQGASTHVPMWVVYASIWVGFGLSILRIVEKYLKLLLVKNQKKED